MVRATRLRLLATLIAVLFAVGHFGHGAMAGGMANSLTTEATMAHGSMPNDCGSCSANASMDVAGCYGLCTSSLTGVMVIQIALGEFAAVTFGAPLSSSDRFGRDIPPDHDPPR